MFIVTDLASLRSLFCLFVSGRLRQVLLYLEPNPTGGPNVYFFFLPPPFFLRALSAFLTLYDLQKACMVVEALTINDISLSAASRLSLARRLSSMICWYSSSRVLNRSSSSCSCFFSSVYTVSISSYSF